LLLRPLTRVSAETLREFRVQSYERIGELLVLADPVKVSASSAVQAAAVVFGETLVPFGAGERLKARAWYLGENLTPVVTYLYSPQA
jgi:hypothetical protein